MRGLPNATTYRFGGEEFLLLAEFEDMDILERGVDRLRERVATLGVAHVDNAPWGRLTVSIGCQRARRWRRLTVMT
jgi:PleD family two-component response regulator